MKLLTAILLCLSLVTLPVGGVIVVNSFLSAAAVSTSYANSGGTGDRTSIITATSNGVNFGTGNATKLLNGTSVFDVWWSGTPVAANVQFDFGSSKVIDEAKFIQSGTVSHGVWQWEGSADASSWTAIGATFTLGGATTDTITELAGNTTSYRYYRLHYISGSVSASVWLYEIEFKISS